jgi:hypothetical protein
VCLAWDRSFRCAVSEIQGIGHVCVVAQPKCCPFPQAGDPPARRWRNSPCWPARSTSPRIKRTTSDSSRISRTYPHPYRRGPPSRTEARAAHGAAPEIDAGAESRCPTATGGGRDACRTRAQLPRRQEHDFPAWQTVKPEIGFRRCKNSGTAPGQYYRTEGRQAGWPMKSPRAFKA